MSDIAVAAQTIWVTDNNNAITPVNTGGSQGFFWASASPNPTISSTSPRQLQNIVERHLNTVGTVFCDGHVKSLKLEDMARTKTLTDPVDGATKNVMTLFTIEND
jgi:prepilin-type processing-associated H-X9-DG protein